MSAGAHRGATPGGPNAGGDWRVRLAGVPVDVIGEAAILSLFERTVAADRRLVLANLNLHALHTALRSPPMLGLLDAPGTVVHVDGQPIVWMARLLRCPIPPKARNTHLDLIPKMLTLCAARGWRVATVGSDAAGAAANEAALQRLAPGLAARCWPGFFDTTDRRGGSEQMRTIAAIRAFAPTLLLVGMGMPRQEAWIAANRELLDLPVVMPVGGFVDYLAGRTTTPPRFLGPLGLEWLYRLAADPRRLAGRYLVEPFHLAALLAAATMRGAKWGRERSPLPAGD